MFRAHLAGDLISHLYRSSTKLTPKRSPCRDRGPSSLYCHTLGLHSLGFLVSDDLVPGNTGIYQNFLEPTRTHHHAHIL